MIGQAPPAYSQDDQNRLREEIRRIAERARNRMQDIELGPNERLIVRREGGVRCRLQFNDDGTVETVPI